MKFAVGYFHNDEMERPFLYTLETLGSRIAEIYFPWPGIASGRTATWSVEDIENLTDSLAYAKENGIGLDLLFNANCYGDNAISKALETTVIRTVQDIAAQAGGVDTITTTSPAVAHIVKMHFPRIRVRASINMQIRNPESCLPLFDLFDEFYLPKECNYLPAEIERWKETLGSHPLYMLANSGCMPYCPGQIFHDNMVAHETGIAEKQNMTGWVPYVCWNWYKKHPEKMTGGTWVRPEDLSAYEKWFPTVKLATRINQHPYRVINAYVQGSFHGNILNLMEPDHSSILQGAWLDNTAFPSDWRQSRWNGTFSAESTYEKVYLKL